MCLFDLNAHSMGSWFCVAFRFHFSASIEVERTCVTNILRHFALLRRQQIKTTINKTEYGFLASRFLPSIFKTYSLQLSTLSAIYNNNNKNLQLQLPTDFAKYQIKRVCIFFSVRCVRLLNLAFPPFHLLPANQPQPTNPRCNRAFLPTNKNTCLKCWTSGRDIMATPTKLGRSEWQQHHRME